MTDGIYEALALLISGNKELWEIIILSFRVSTVAILISIPFAFSLAYVLAYYNFAGKRIIIALTNTMLSFPAVVVGLIVYMLLSKQGLLGHWRILFTQKAMIMAQVILCFPILVAFGHAAFQSIHQSALETSTTLGKTFGKRVVWQFFEARFALLSAIATGFGRIISEVGASMIVGGNILHYTRNIPTAIALETSKGAFAQGIALGLVLLFFSFILNIVLNLLQGRVEQI